jgi:putative acetyltransferase
MSTVEPPRLSLERPDQQEVRALIAALDAYQQPLYPPESHHGIDERSLRDPAVLFAVARGADERVTGCGAVLLTPRYAELKRMFTAPSQRGRGFGTALLRFIEEEARARGATRFTLETGYLQREALRLYERAGYSRCAPFGDYAPDATSVFMEKVVEPFGAPRVVSVWRATVDDVADAAPLFDAYRQFYGRRSELALAEGFLRERLSREESTVLLARDASGTACGFAQLYPVFSSVRASRQLVLNDLFVQRTSRRAGVGHALLDAAARFARSRGVARMKLSTAIDNVAAQRLYDSLGWVRDTGFYEYNLDLPNSRGFP